MQIQNDLFSDGKELYARVVFDLPVNKSYHYRVPKPLRKAIRPGCRVRVQFGRKVVSGYCVGLDETPDVQKVHDIIELIDMESLISHEMLDLTEWVAEYYFCGWGEVLNAALPAPVRQNKGVKKASYVALSIDPDDIPEIVKNELKRSPKQARALEVIRTLAGNITLRDLAKRAGCTPDVIKNLHKRGFLDITEEEVAPNVFRNIKRKRSEDMRLLPDQQAVFEKFLPVINEKRFDVMLLHGVTGSGKTEVYLQLLRRVVEQGRRGLVLVPEIALTQQTIDRFLSRFPKLAILHSMMTNRERSWEWRRINRGEVDVVVGARSAVFAPIDKLGLVIIDEEYDSSFKQESPAPRYHARDVAIVRARNSGAGVILGSATPSMESYFNAVVAKKYIYAELPERVAQRPLPPVTLVDMRSELLPDNNVPLFSQMLIHEIRDRLSRNEQIMIFLNRRGYHTVAVCLRCGYVVKCPKCDSSLTHHRRRSLMICHYCDYNIPVPKKCPECYTGSVRFYGFGTERVEKTMNQLFPEARIERMDSDVMIGQGAHREVLSKFRDREIDILVGTQMITKGLDFPNVTLVGVVSADTLLNLPDFRAGERTFQMLAQVAGRTGRGPLGGQVIIQSMNTDNYVIRCAQTHDFDSFAKRELGDRNKIGLPPFLRLIRIIVAGKNESSVIDKIKKISDSLRILKGDALKLRGPSPAPMTLLNGQFRWHIVLHVKDRSLVMRALNSLYSETRSGKDITVSVDVDPAWML